MILTRRFTERLLIDKLNNLSLQYPHFANDLTLAKDNCRVQLDMLYSMQPTDKQVYLFLLSHNVDQQELSKRLPYSSYKSLMRAIT